MPPIRNTNRKIWHSLQVTQYHVRGLNFSTNLPKYSKFHQYNNTRHGLLHLLTFLMDFLDLSSFGFLACPTWTWCTQLAWSYTHTSLFFFQLFDDFKSCLLSKKQFQLSLEILKAVIIVFLPNQENNFLRNSSEWFDDPRDFQTKTTLLNGSPSNLHSQSIKC